MIYCDKGCNINNTCAFVILPEWYVFFFGAIQLLLAVWGRNSLGTSWRLCCFSQIFRQGVLNSLLPENYRLRPTVLLSLCKLHVTSKSPISAALSPFLWHFQECMIMFGMCVNDTQNTKPWTTAVTLLHHISSFVIRYEYNFNLLRDCMKHCSISRLETGGNTRRK